jgi:predicted site-specific integrase-resolvase
MICAYHKAVGSDSKGDNGQDLNADSERSWLTSQQVANEWGCHINSVRAWSDSGKLPCHRVEGKFSHRRFLRVEVEAALGCPRRSEKGEKGSVGANRPIAIYARCSTAKQSRGFSRGEDGSDLARQVERLKAYVEKEYGCLHPIELADCGSGLSFTRKGLQKLMAMLLDGSLDNGIIVCTHVDRLARWGSELIIQVAKSRNCEVVFCEREEDRSEDEMNEIATEVIQVLTHLSAKYHGKRASQTLKAPLDGATIKAALKLKAQGFNANQAAKVLAAQNHLNGKGRKVSAWNVQTLFETCGDTLNGLVEGEQGNSFEEWAKVNLERVEGERGRCNAIHRSYSAWAASQGMVPLSNISIQRYLKTHYGYHTYKAKRVYHVRMKS